MILFVLCSYACTQVAAQQGAYLARNFNHRQQCIEHPEGPRRFRGLGRHHFRPFRYIIYSFSLIQLFAQCYDQRGSLFDLSCVLSLCNACLRQITTKNYCKIRYTWESPFGFSITISKVLFCHPKWHSHDI